MRTNKLWIHGISGKMGQALLAELPKHPNYLLEGGSHSKMKDSELLNGISESSVLLDFSNKDGNAHLLKLLETTDKIPRYLLLAATGLSEEAITKWSALADRQPCKILLAENTSLGIGALLRAAIFLVPILGSFDIELCETHHRDKKDAPSGTALLLAESIAKYAGLKIAFPSTQKREPKTLGLSWQRGGGVFGEHSVRFIGAHEEIALSHRAFSRELFASGTFFMLDWLLKEGELLPMNFLRLAHVYSLPSKA